MVRFSGMDPWKEDYGIIEVRCDGKLFDLHNFGAVIAVEHRPPDVLNFRFVLDEPPWDLTLQFLNVTKLSVRRTERESPVKWWTLAPPPHLIKR